MRKNKINIIFAIVFLVIISVPSTVLFLGIEGSYSNDENRNIQKFPEFRIRHPISFFRSFTLYYIDNFGLRLALFNTYNYILTNWLEESPLPRKVIIGKKGWYYLGDENSNVISETLGADQFSKSELANISRKIKNANDWLKSKNINFYVCVAPNKHSVYGENLPFLIKNDKKRLSILKKYLKAKINFNLIDLKELIIKSKDSIQLYHKTDSHWNDYGAFLGYRKLMEFVSKDFKNLKIIEPKNLKIDSIHNSFIGGLTKMINKKVIESIPNISILDSIKSREVLDEISVPQHFKREIGIYEYRYKKKNSPFKVIIFRDSFSQNLRKYLNETFGECVYIWDFKFDKKLIEKEKPDIVIYELVERFLEKLEEI